MNFIKQKTIFNSIFFIKTRRHDQLDGEDLLSSSGGKKSPYKGTGPKTKHGKGKKRYKRDQNSGADQHETKKSDFLFSRGLPFFVWGNEGMPIGLRSEIDDAYAQEWYRQMYRSLNRRRPSNINGYCGSKSEAALSVDFLSKSAEETLKQTN